MGFLQHISACATFLPHSGLVQAPWLRHPSHYETACLLSRDDWRTFRRGSCACRSLDRGARCRSRWGSGRGAPRAQGWQHPLDPPDRADGPAAYHRHAVPRPGLRSGGNGVPAEVHPEWEGLFRRCRCPNGSRDRTIALKRPTAVRSCWPEAPARLTHRGFRPISNPDFAARSWAPPRERPNCAS